MSAQPNETSKKVSAEQYADLQKADEVIREVKQLLPFGSANIPNSGRRWDEKESARRTYFVYKNTEEKIRGKFHNNSGEFNKSQKIFDEESGIYREDVQKKYGTMSMNRKPRYSAFTAVIAGSGNCDQCGAIAYYLCRELFSQDYIAFYVSAPGHTFALVGKASEIASGTSINGWKTAIAVDPWMPKAQALLYKHHFKFGANLSIRKFGRGRGGTVGVKDKYIRAVNTIRKALDEFLRSKKQNINTYPQYVDVYPSKFAGRVNYYVTAASTPSAPPTENAQSILFRLRRGETLAQPLATLRPRIVRPRF